MAEVRHGWDAPFDRLPDEVVVNIFSYLSHNELLDVLENVCLRWKRLAHTPALWLDKEYVIRGRCWRLQGRACCGVYFSQCAHCRCHRTDAEVLRAVGTMPQLRRLTVMRAVRGRVLRDICASCPNLTNLHIECTQNVNYAVMKHIFEKCPKIRKLKLPAGILSDARCAQLLSGLEHLRCLTVVSDFQNSAYVKMRIVADACRHLEEFHTDSCEYDVRDVEYFLQARRHSLTAVTLDWTLGVMEKWCAVSLLLRCETSVRRLELGAWMVRPEMEAAALEALCGLRGLRELRADRLRPLEPHLLSLPFRPGCLSQLQVLHLRYVSNLLDETVVTISQGCPNLRELRFVKSENITDEALSEIHRLKHLEILELSACSGLGGSAVARAARLPALRTLVLMALDLAQLQPGLRHVLDLKRLRCLDILNTRNVAALPLDEFPGRLLKLRELHVSNKAEHKNVVAELQRRMPHLRIVNAFRETEDEFFTGMEIRDRDGEDEEYFGDDFYYNFRDEEDDDDDDNDDDRGQPKQIWLPRIITLPAPN